MYTFSVCVLLGHWGQLHLPFSQGQPADTLGPQTLSQRLGERMEKYEYKYLHSDLHVQLLALAVCIIYVVVVVVVLGELVSRMWCFILA